MSRIAKKSALLKTSAATNVKRSGGVVSITGLEAFRQRNILTAKQIKYKAEVVQVVTMGGGSYTPAGSTNYIVELINPAFARQGNILNSQKKYAYKTPVDITTLGATAALQREAIHAALVAMINPDSRNYVAAVSLGTGTGFTITDDAGYFPARLNGASNGRQGATIVKAVVDSDGTGWVDATVNSITTAAVYGFGVGLRLSQDAPVIAAYVAGNLISGELDAPVASDGTYAVSGQKYDAFLVSVLKRCDIPTITGVEGYQAWEQAVFVDNGTGTDVTNLAGFKAFEREMHKLIFGQYDRDPKSVIEFFDKPMVFQGPLGAAPAGTANVLQWTLSPYGSLNWTNIGTQTIVAPVLNATGLLIDQDDNAGDGAHYSANQQTLGCQSFIVGTDEAALVARVVMGDWTDSHLLVGFRIKAAYTADYNDYTDLASVGSGAAAGDTITTQGILNNAATLITASAVSYADAVSVQIRVHVAISGAVTVYVNGVSYPIYSTGTTPMVFDAGDEIIPFFQHVNIGSGDPAVSISEFVAISDSNWIID